MQPEVPSCLSNRLRGRPTDWLHWLPQPLLSVLRNLEPADLPS